MSFCISTSPTQAVQGPIAAGSPATYSLQVNSFAGFTGSAALACAITTQPGVSEPIYVTGCSFNVSPATVSITPASPGVFQVTVNTSATPASSISLKRATPWNQAIPAATWALIATLLLCVLTLRVRLRAPVKLFQVATLVVACAVSMAACGGGGGAADPPPVQGGDFQYDLVVTATFSAAGQPNVQSQFTIPMVVEVD
jgi:hypothetical protein